MAIPTEIPGMAGGKGLLQRVTPFADDAAALVARPRSNGNADDPSLKDQAVDVLTGGVDLNDPSDAFAPVDKAVNGIGMVAGIAGSVLAFNEMILSGGSWVTDKMAGLSWMPFKKTLTATSNALYAPSKHVFNKKSPLGLSSEAQIKEHNDAIDRNKDIPRDEKQRNKLGNIGNDVFHATFVIESGVQTYNTTRSFFQKKRILNAIRDDMAADRKARGLSGPVGNAAPLADAEKHNGLEHALRGAAAITGLVLNFRAMRAGRMNWVTQLAPMLASMGVDAFMGDPELIEAYVPFTQVQKSGHATQMEYAKFLYTVSKDINSQGKRGQEIAMKIAAQYKAENATAAHMLNDMASGAFKELVHKAKVDVEAAHPPAQHSHVAALKKNGQQPLPEAKGMHSGKIVSERTQQQAPGEKTL